MDMDGCGWIWMDMDGLNMLESGLDPFGPRHPFLQVLLALGFFVPHEGELVIAWQGGRMRPLHAYVRGGSGFSSNKHGLMLAQSIVKTQETTAGTGTGDERGGLPPCSAMWTFGMMMTSPAAKYLATHSLPSWVQRHVHRHVHDTINHGCNAGNIMEYLFVQRATIGKLRRIKIGRPILFASTWFFDGNWIWNNKFDIIYPLPLVI